MEVIGRLCAPATAFRAGQFFLHREHGYRGVVVLEAAAAARESREWQMRHGVMGDVTRLGAADFYVALIDERDRKLPSFYYVNADNMVPYVSLQPLRNQLLGMYFTEFKNGAYVPLAGATR